MKPWHPDAHVAVTAASITYLQYTLLQTRYIEEDAALQKWLKEHVNRFWTPDIHGMHLSKADHQRLQRHNAKHHRVSELLVGADAVTYCHLCGTLNPSIPTPPLFDLVAYFKSFFFFYNVLSSHTEVRQRQSWTDELLSVQRRHQTALRTIKSGQVSDAGTVTIWHSCYIHVACNMNSISNNYSIS